MLLKKVIKSPTKAVSIGQSIIQASRQRSCIAPVMFAVGVQMDHIFGSKWLVTQLARLGFSICPEEVTRYKQSVLATEETTDVLKTYLPGAFTMWIADKC